MVINVGINGFGRIGRVIFRTCLENPEIEVSAINDPAVGVEYICYLMKFDSTHGKLDRSITHQQDEITIDGKTIKIFHQKQPSAIPWNEAQVQYVVESSGMFTSLDRASGHLSSEGVKRVVVTAPSVDVPMIILGVNDSKLHADMKVMSCASSTLYCLAPIVKLLQDHYGVTEGFVTSIHAMTPSLKPLDGLCLRGKHWRDHRSIHQNIIPATTGACKALGRIIPQVKDKLSGLAFRVPIVNVSVLDLTIRLNVATKLQDIVEVVANESVSGRLQNIIQISNEEAVSSDFIGEKHSCTLDVDSSLQLKPNFFKLICWYENEYSYACRIVDSILFSEKQFSERDIKARIPCLCSKYSRKQNVVQRTELCKKENMGVECKCSSNNSKISSQRNVSSQDNCIKIKTPSRSVILKKPMSTPKTSSASASNRDTRKRYDIFKIWNDDSKVVHQNVRQNRSSFFQSCMAFAPQNSEKTDCMKAQERLEKVKKEFSKMVDITEDLLKKSYSNKVQLNTTDKSSENVNNDKSNANVESENFYIKALERCQTLRKNNPIIDISGDYTCICKTNMDNGSNNRVKTLPPVGGKTEDKENDKQRVHSVFNNFTAGVSSSDIITKTTEKSVKEQRYSDDKICNNLKYSNNVSDRMIKEQCTESINVMIRDRSPNVKTDLNTESEVIKSEVEEFTASSVQKTSTASECKLITPDNKETEANNSEKSNCLNETKLSVYFNKALSKIEQIEEELKKRNIVIVNDRKELTDSESDIKIVCKKSIHEKDMELRHKILESIKKAYTPDPIIVVSENTSRCTSPANTNTTISNGEPHRRKQDLYDKLDSASDTDSDNSFQINERKSQIININDLTNSLDDLLRLDKICKIIEISDDLSNELFSALDNENGNAFKKQKWSFKDLCEKIKLDEFCNRVFTKSGV